MENRLKKTTESMKKNFNHEIMDLFSELIYTLLGFIILGCNSFSSGVYHLQVKLKLFLILKKKKINFKRNYIKKETYKYIQIKQKASKNFNT